MAKVTRKFTVKRKPEAVIDYISDVENHPAFIPPLKSVANIAGDPKRKGTHWDWTFVMAGVEINGKPDGMLKVAAVPKQTADPLFIGRRTDGLFNDAALADVAIYSVALSADRIAAHWQAASGTH